eukprot:3282048-Amphidinium_carterae.1
MQSCIGHIRHSLPQRDGAWAVRAKVSEIGKPNAALAALTIQDTERDPPNPTPQIVREEEKRT